MKLSYHSYKAFAGFKKDLPPILFLHGMLDSKESWKDLASSIADNTGRKAYWMDARNHGDSPWSEEFNFDVLSQDVIDFMKEREISKAVLVGSSMGGTTAMKLALENPALVDKLVVLEMMPKPFPMTGWKVVVAVMLMMEEALGAIRKGVDIEMARCQAFLYLSQKMPDSSPTNRIDFAAGVLPIKRSGDGFEWKTNLVSMEKILIRSNELDKPLAGSFSGDALFLYGTKSYMKVDKDETIPQLFPNAKLIPVEGATHMLQFEEPRKFVDAVTKFINGT